MSKLTADEQDTCKLLLGYTDLPHVHDIDIIDEHLAQNFDLARYTRIIQIINLLTGQPTGECDPGGVDYQLDRAGFQSNLIAVDKVRLDHASMIRNLRNVGTRLLGELSNIIGVRVHYNKYSATAKKSFHSSYHT